MAKNYKLQSKKKTVEADGRFYIRGGFFHRYTVTRAGNIVVMILEGLSLAATAIFALCLGVLGSLSMMAEGYEGIISTIQGYYQAGVTLWLVSSIIYVVGTIILFLGFSRIASAVHGVALVLSLVMYYVFGLMSSTANLETAGPAAIYMPCIFIAIISLAIAAVVNVPLWLDKKAEQDAEVAPSILTDDEKEG